MRYTANGPTEQAAMLAAIGSPNIEALLESIPREHRALTDLAVRGPIPEAELLLELEGLVAKPPRVSLVGAGLYDHYIPSTARSLFSRSEWVTSYTPYQPETAQGTLVMYYEFQTYVALMTGQEIANGGMYDGSTALVEAVLMAARLRPNKKRVLVSQGVHPEYRAVLRTYARFAELELVTLPLDLPQGSTTFGVSAADQRDALAVVIQSPNYLGVLESRDALDPAAYVISVCAEAQALALVPPLSAAISVGEMQSLGIPIQLGGPTAGFFATSKANVRQLPGRLVARTKDQHGRTAYCITLATREQFIRREKATSNICTSSGLMCLRAVIYLSLMGSRGLVEVARRSAKAARFLRSGLESLGLRCPVKGPIFNEFVVDVRSHPGLADRLSESGFVFGHPLDDFDSRLAGHRLLAVTEVQYPRVQSILEEVARHVRRS